MKYLVLAAILVLASAWSSDAAVSGLTSQIRGFTFTSNMGTWNPSLIVVRYTGLTTYNLVQGTEYTVANTGSSGSWSVTISALNSGNYTVSDDGGATNAPYGGSGQLTLCMNPDIPQIALDSVVSTTYQGGPTNRLRLRLRFNENNRYINVFYRYRGGEGNCNSSVNSAADATYQNWARTTNTTNCGGPFMLLEQDFNTALSLCNWFRDESNPNLTTYNATIIITTTDTGVVVRGNRYPRTLETAIVVRVSFQTNVSASLGGVTVFGPRITMSQVTQQLWNPTTFVATVTVLTSVQWPYQLAVQTLTPSNTSLWSTSLVAPTVAEVAADTFGNYNLSSRSRCYQSYTTTPATGTLQTANQVCNQYWTVTLSRAASCGGGISLTLEGVFDMFFNVTCSGLFTGACSVPAPFIDAIRFSTNSTNYCPQLITNNNLNSATLTAYSNTGYSVTQNQYVFGTITYFEAVVNSPILMNSLGVESILLTQGGTIGGANYYTRTFSNAGTWFSQTPASNGVWATGPGSCSIQSQMTVTDNSDGNTNVFTKRIRFSILWSSCTSAAVGDSPITTTVQVNMRIRYTNQSTSATIPVLMALSQKYRSQSSILDVNEENTALATVGIAATGSIDDGGVASSSSAGETMSALVIGIIAGVAALAMVIVAATVVLLRRNKSKSEHSSSVELNSTTSAETASTTATQQA